MTRYGSDQGIKPLRLLTALLALAICSFCLLSCGGDEPDPEPAPAPAPVDPLQPTSECDRTLLLYSVASNNLEVNLMGDRAEMMRAGEDIPGLDSDVRVLLYMVVNSGNPTLSELKRGDDGKCSFSVIKEYDRSRFSTDPARITEVIGDAVTLRPASRYGLLFASHGTGWTPDFAAHSSRSCRSVRPAPDTSFGQDRFEGDSDSVDVAELADAIPSGTFDYIWFDACYMAGIETVYQFRYKCDRFAGYVTEIYGSGMPYDMTLPLLARRDADLEGAAGILFDCYDRAGEPVSVSVVRTDRLQPVAEACRDVWSARKFPSSYQLQKYHRYSHGPFYDFGQMVSLSGDGSEESAAAVARFRDALASAVLFSRLSKIDFSYQPLDTEVFSGLSSALPSQLGGARKEYYLSLDWGRAVFPDGLDIEP